MQSQKRGWEVMTIGFIVNPIAGMGGSVGLKGTDGNLLEEALKRGARPVSPVRARRFLRRLHRLCFTDVIVSAGGVMGCDYLREVPLNKIKCLDVPTSSKTSGEDTRKISKMLADMGVELIVFVGGDGTARDVLDGVGGKVPILGIPAGVKMYSGVFAASPEAAADIVIRFLDRSASLELVEVADADEEAISKGLLRVRVYGYVHTPVVEGLLIPSKEFASGSAEEKLEVAEYFVNEVMEDNALYIMGPGSTIKAIADLLHIDKTLLGVDAIYNRKLIGRDLSESELLDIMKGFNKKYIVITIIGKQGYIFGRGNQQISPKVIRGVGTKNIYVLSTRSKLLNLRRLLVDTGDPELDKELSGYIRVIVGYHEEKIMPVIPASVPEYLAEV